MTFHFLTPFQITNYQLWSNTYGGNTIRVQVSGGSSEYYNPAVNCTNLDSYMVSDALSKAVQQRIFSVLLAGSLANKPVRLSLATNACEKNRPRILNVTIQ